MDITEAIGNVIIMWCGNVLLVFLLVELSFFDAVKFHHIRERSILYWKMRINAIYGYIDDDEDDNEFSGINESLLRECIKMKTKTQHSVHFEFRFIDT